MQVVYPIWTIYPRCLRTAAEQIGHKKLGEDLEDRVVQGGPRGPRVVRAMELNYVRMRHIAAARPCLVAWVTNLWAR